jgi:hypothetical protein
VGSNEVSGEVLVGKGVKGFKVGDIVSFFGRGGGVNGGRGGGGEQ